jgi:DNA-binding XRE family transcriptional regulator
VARHRLKHYLRTYRRRFAFSQEEIALLLGASSGTKVSRYESFKRHPPVIAVFAYEIIFNQPIQDLFAGAYDAVRRDVQTRAKELLKALEAERTNPRTSLKLQLLRAIVESKLEPPRRD